MTEDMQYLTIALPKGKLFYLAKDLFAKVGYSAEKLEEKSRKLVITNEELKIKFIIAKTADVPVYVEHGAADIGIIGKDVLMESDKDVYELLDLGFGKCHLMMAVPKDKKTRQTDRLCAYARCYEIPAYRGKILQQQGYADGIHQDERFHRTWSDCGAFRKHRRYRRNGYDAA